MGCASSKTKIITRSRSFQEDLSLSSKRRTNELPLSEGFIKSKNEDERQNLQLLCSAKSQESSAHQDTINPREMKSGLEEEEEPRTQFSFNTINQWPQHLEIEEIREAINNRFSFSDADGDEESKKKIFSSLKKSDSGAFVKNDMQYFIRNGARLLQELITSTHGKTNLIPTFSAKELQKATNNFSPDMIVGRGLSLVYKGIIEDRHVAVKTYADGFFVMFIKEIVGLSLIKHRNVVKLLGCCIELENPMLVYEFLPNGNLYEKIWSTELLWKEGFRIAMEVADALAYMHQALEVPITPGFVSSRSILLDEFDSAKLGTFGFSTVQKKPVNSDNESDLRNTSAKGRDVHFFGMMMVDLLTENMFTEEYHFITKEEIPKSVYKNLCQKDMQQIESCSNLAVRCISLGLYEKPSIKEIVQELRHIARCFI